MHMQPLGRLAEVQAVIGGLFDIPVAVGVTDPRVPQPASIGEEAAHLALAVPARRNEFAAGRTAARTALSELDHAAAPIPSHDDRAPIWPVGFQGSISHTKSLCAAVVTRAVVSLGLDMEENTDLAQGLVSTICSDAEAARIAGPDMLRLSKLIFCAKEAVYKAQYPLTGLLIGFDHVDIHLGGAGQTFTAIFLKPAGCFAAGDALTGRCDVVANHLVTGVCAGQVGTKGA